MERHFDNSDFQVPLGPIFDTRTGNEWREETKNGPMPGKLLGDMWIEGEIALLLSDHGLGKSILAVQIAESIARGKPIFSSPPARGGVAGVSPDGVVEAFEMTAKPQPVVLLDLEMSGRQFTTRYIADDDEDETADYDFSADFHRARVDPYAPVPKECSSFSDYLCRAARRLCLEKGAKVLIVDGISQLKHSNDASRDLLPLMKGLDRLRRDEAIAILVLAPARNRLLARSIAIRTLMGANLICERVDSVIAIGPSGYGVKHRYIKHLRSKGSEILCDKTNVPAFRIEKIDGNFLGFVFDGFSPESDHFEPRAESYDWEMIDRVKRMHDDDMTFRDIAAEVGLSKSTVCELYHKWRPGMKDGGTQRHGDAETVVNEYYFPGREEYTEAGRDPRFNNIYDREGEEFALLRREAYKIEAACAKARQEYLKTGSAPTLAEMLARMRDAETAQKGSPPYEGGVAAASADGVVFSPDKMLQDGGGAVDGPLEPDGKPEAFRTSSGTAGNGKNVPMAGLQRATNEYGREIFIEKEDNNGKRRVWYERDKKGGLWRRERKIHGIFSERVEDPP